MSKRKNILVVRPDRIGDVVLSTPIPRELKKQFPDCSVSVFVREYTKDIYANNPYVDEILIFEGFQSDGISGFLSDTAKIRKYKFTHALMLLPNERINYLLFFAGILTRVGSGHKFYQFITGVKSVSRHNFIPLRHEADYCMDLARRIGVKTDNLKSEIFLTDEQKIKVEEKKKKLLVNKKYFVGIHSTSGNSAPNWPVERYAELIGVLSEKEELRVAVTDNNVPEKISNLENVVYPNVEKTLSESLVNFAALDILISASTGPMHIAAGLGVKTLALFCPMTACSPKLWAPQGNVSLEILPTETYCKTQCPGDPKKCTMDKKGGIEVNLISAGILEILKTN